MAVPRYALLFLALFVPFSYFNHSDGWNQGVRIAELHAIVIKGTLRIDDYLAYTGDRALIDGHYYSEKAPAMVLFALPSFALTVAVQKLLGVDPDSPSAGRVSQWIATAASVGLLAALGGVAFFALLRTRFDALTSVLATFGLFLGSITWPYATSLFAHAGTIGLMAIALWGTLGPGSPRRDVLAGLAAGFAVASEYPAIFPGVVLGLRLGMLDVRRMWRYGLATMPAAALILANNYAISGSRVRVELWIESAVSGTGGDDQLRFRHARGGRDSRTVMGRVSRALFLEPGAAHGAAGFLLHVQK